MTQSDRRLHTKELAIKELAIKKLAIKKLAIKEMWNQRPERGDKAVRLAFNKELGLSHQFAAWYGATTTICS